jgi:tetratricopeptide (TPR) repeat protein
MYKVDRALETIKKVIYSVDTPQSLLVDSCILLGNIYSDKNDSDEAYLYYEKAIESLDENVDKSVRTELYFKYALSLDDKGNSEKAFEYYDKCIALGGNSPYISFAYSNIASCYFENENYDEARACFKKAYDLDKKDNNYDGIYYNASHLAKIAVKFGSKNAYLYLTEAKKSAEFINDEFCILESTLALGDYYYNNSSKYKECLKEYFMARNQAVRVSYNVELVKIEKRINDMRLRMDKSDFEEVEAKYGK